MVLINCKVEVILTPIETNHTFLEVLQQLLSCCENRNANVSSTFSFFYTVFGFVLFCLLKKTFLSFLFIFIIFLQFDLISVVRNDILLDKVK